MRTLSEVIACFEKACDLERRCENCSGCLGQENGCPNDGAESVPDALEYLKEYRSKQDTIAEQLAELEQKNDHVCELAKTVCEEYDRLCNRLAEEYRNDPLTWEEFCKMGDKAVWIEVHGAKALHTSGWALVGNTSFTTWAGVPSCSLVKVGVTYALPIDEYGKTWQAYRKEVDVSSES